MTSKESCYTDHKKSILLLSLWRYTNLPYAGHKESAYAVAGNNIFRRARWCWQSETTLIQYIVPKQNVGHLVLRNLQSVLGSIT